MYCIVQFGYCTGSLIGPQTFRQTEAPTYRTAIVTMLVGYCVSILLLVVYGFLCWRDNQRRDAAIDSERIGREDSHETQSVATEWKDLTDKQVRLRPWRLRMADDRIRRSVIRGSMGSLTVEGFLLCEVWSFGWSWWWRSCIHAFCIPLIVASMPPVGYAQQCVRYSLQLLQEMGVPRTPYGIQTFKEKVC